MNVFTLYNDCTMYIKLTNASPQHRGTDLALRKDLIVSVHNSTVTREDNTVELVTFLHCPPHGTWEASNSFESVIAQLNQE
jgi:Icc-related predicted phosphoesterase